MSGIMLDKDKTANISSSKLEDEQEKKKILKILTGFMDWEPKYVNVEGGRNFLTNLQIRVLFEIPDNGYIPAWKLAKKFGYSYNGVKGIYSTLLSLYDRGLIEIEKNIGKRGGMYVALTEYGKKVKEKLIEMAEEERKEIGDEEIEKALEKDAKREEEARKRWEEIKRERKELEERYGVSSEEELEQKLEDEFLGSEEMIDDEEENYDEDEEESEG